MFHRSIAESLRAQSLKIEDLQREVAGLRQDVKRLLFLLGEKCQADSSATCSESDVSVEDYERAPDS